MRKNSKYKIKMKKLISTNVRVYNVVNRELFKFCYVKVSYRRYSCYLKTLEFTIDRLAVIAILFRLIFSNKCLLKNLFKSSLN